MFLSFSCVLVSRVTASKTLATTDESESRVLFYFLKEMVRDLACSIELWIPAGSGISWKVQGSVGCWPTTRDSLLGTLNKLGRQRQ